MVEAFVGDAELCERLRNDVFRGMLLKTIIVCPCNFHTHSPKHTGMPDVERLTRKLDLQRATLADLCALFRASGKLEALVLALQAHEGAHAPLLCSRCVVWSTSL